MKRVLSKLIKHLLIILATGLCVALKATGQTPQGPQANPYVLNGSASQVNCNCYILTPATAEEIGSVWNKNKIDLTQSFDYHFNVFLGCINSIQGADGIAFVLQPISTSIGTLGQGLGFGGVIPSLGIEIDTYPNLDEGDPPYDHISFQANGDVSHNDSNNLAGPVQALADSPSIKDCKWHVFEVNWNAATYTLTVYMDGVKRLSMTKDIVSTIFGGNPSVFWGFTGATGGSFNLQQFCTSLNAHYTTSASQKYCEDVPITFADSSTSFGSIVKYTWNFGDGTTDTVPNPPPHVYPSPGYYALSLTVLGNNGCADTQKTNLAIGSYPVPAFTVNSACIGQPLGILNQTLDTVGPIATWTWTLSTGQTYTDSIPSIILSQGGSYSMKLSAISAEGCASNTTASVPFEVTPTPAVTFQGGTVCAGSPIALTGSALNPAPIEQWYWNLGPDGLDSMQAIAPVFNKPDTINVHLWAMSPFGCSSDTMTQPVVVEESFANAGRDTVEALGYPLQLQATGGAYYQWSPPDGLSDPNIANPVANLTQDTRLTVTAFTPFGCPSYASILVKVYKGPAIYVPTAFTPNGDGYNDVLKITAPGIEKLTYFRIYDRWGNLVFETTDTRATWDGTFGGKPQKPGAYIWMIQGIDLLGKPITERGTVVLIR